MKNLILTLALIFTLTSFSQEVFEYDLVHIEASEINVKAFVKPSGVKRITILGQFFIVDDFSEKHHMSYTIIEKKEFEDNTILYVLEDGNNNVFRATKFLDENMISLYKDKDSKDTIIYFEKK